MELYHWYKGNELPDRECDCVVVFGFGSDRQTNIAHVSFSKSGRIEIKIELFGVINPYAVKVWMPIEFPKEESQNESKR